MNNFLVSTVAQQEIMSLDQKIYETVDSIKALKTKREFMLSFASDPYGFINKWLISQSRDLKVAQLTRVNFLLNIVFSSLLIELRFTNLLQLCC